MEEASDFTGSGGFPGERALSSGGDTAATGLPQPCTGSSVCASTGQSRM